MRLFQNGAIQFKFPSHLARRPPTTTRPFSRNHQHRTKSSDSTPSDPPEKPDTNPPKPSHTQPNPHPPGSVASSAGASTPPVPGPAASRSLTQIIQAGPVGRAGRSYSRVQDRRPYLTQIVSSLVVYLCGDLSAQVLFPSESPKEAKDEDKARDENEEESDPEPTGSYDPMRTLRHLTVGIVSSIPSYKWFMFLHRNFNFASKFLSILTKVLIQQLVFTPVFNCYFFSVHSLLGGATLDETIERLKLTMPLAFMNSAKLWPAVTAFSFMYVPPQFRSVFSGSVAVGWQTYLSWLNQTAAKEVEEAELEMEQSGAVGLRVAVPA